MGSLQPLLRCSLPITATPWDLDIPPALLGILILPISQGPSVSLLQEIPRERQGLVAFRGTELCSSHRELYKGVCSVRLLNVQGTHYNGVDLSG